MVTLGGCVWVIGGSTSPFVQPTAHVEKYCPQIDATRWVLAPPLPEARSDFAGVGVIGGKAYVAGGIDASVQDRNTLFVLDPLLGWSVSPDVLPSPMSCGGGGAVVNGRLYVLGYRINPANGNVDCEAGLGAQNAFASYDPTGSAGLRWTSLPPVPSWAGCSYTLSRFGNIVEPIGGSDCIGGQNWSSGYAFDIAASSWVVAPTFLPKYSHGAVALGGLVIAAGGQNSFAFPGLDPTMEVWAYSSATKNWDGLRPLSVLRKRLGITALNGGIVVAGGIDMSTGQPSGTVEQLKLVAGCDIHEPNATTALAGPWNMPVDLAGRPYANPMTQSAICSKTDVDYFLLTNIWPYSFDIVMTPPAGYDYQMALLDPTGKVLQRSASVGSVSERVSVPGGTGFYIVVKSQDGRANPSTPYRLETQCMPPLC